MVGRLRMISRNRNHDQHSVVVPGSVCMIWEGPNPGVLSFAGIDKYYSLIIVYETGKSRNPNTFLLYIHKFYNSS